MISIIVSSKNAILFDKLETNIRTTIGVDFELLKLINTNGSFGICEVYNKLASQAKFEYLVFCHEDILFHEINWGGKIINHLNDDSISLLGVLGATIKSHIPSGAHTYNKEFLAIRHYQRTLEMSTNFYLNKPCSKEDSCDVAALDGLFLSCRKSKWETYKFDEIGLKHFHGYDIDFSLGQSQNGRVIVVYDILIEHFSYGTYDLNWINAQLYVTNKWKKLLPLTTTNSRNYKKLVIENLNALLLIMIKSKYDNIIIFSKYLLIIIFYNPIQRLNLSFIKHLIVRIILKKILFSLNISQN